MKKTYTKRVRTTERVCLEITGKQLIEILRQANIIVPTSAQVMIRVPGGGDWSNMDLDVDNTCPVQIVYEEHSDTTDEKEDEVEHLSPYAQRKLVEERVNEGDNDDAKLDLICQALGLDHETAIMSAIRSEFAKLTYRIEKQLAKEEGRA